MSHTRRYKIVTNNVKKWLIIVWRILLANAWKKLFWKRPRPGVASLHPRIRWQAASLLGELTVSTLWSLPFVWLYYQYILSFSTQYQMQWSSQLRSYVSRHWKGLTKRHVFGWNSSSNPQNRRGPLNRRIKRYSIPFCSNWILATAHVLMTISYHVPPYMYLLLLLAYSSSINVLIRSICFYSGSYAGYRCAGPCLWVALHSGMPHQHAVSFQRTHSDAACEGYRADWIWLMKTA